MIQKTEKGGGIAGVLLLLIGSLVLEKDFKDGLLDSEVDTHRLSGQELMGQHQEHILQLSKRR